MKCNGVGSDWIWFFELRLQAEPTGILIVTGKSPQDRFLDLFRFCALFQFLQFELDLEREKWKRIPNHEYSGGPQSNGIDFPHLGFQIN